MKEFRAFTIGLLARGISILAASYADWLFGRISDSEDGFNFLRDLRRFARWFVRTIAGQISGYGRHEYVEDDPEPELFGSR
jgi:hypothetical protein